MSCFLPKINGFIYLRILAKKVLKNTLKREKWLYINAEKVKFLKIFITSKNTLYNSQRDMLQFNHGFTKERKKNMNNTDILKKLADVEPKFNLSTGLNILRRVPNLYDALAFDDDRGACVLLKDVVLDSTLTLDAGLLTDTHYTALQVFLSRCGFDSCGVNTFMALVDLLAHEHKTTAWKRALDEITAVGKYRPSIYREIMVDGLHAPDSEYSIFWLKSLLGAIYHNQSYKGDLTNYSPTPLRFIMFGQQGLGKSIFTQRLSFGSQVDFDGDLASSDAKQVLTSKIIINADDKASGKTSIVDAIKSAISTPSYTFRRSYGRTNITKLNRAVWVGSTNRLYVYTDTTGNRREMPIELGTDLTKDQARQAGQEWYKFITDQDPRLFLDLWATFLQDYPYGFESLATVGSDLDKEREKIVKARSSMSDVERAIYDLLDTKTPDYINNYDKLKAAAYLVGFSVKGVDKNALVIADSATLIKLGEMEAIKAPIFNTAIRALVKTSISTIENIMNDIGYTLSRRSDGNYYVKR